jgi:myosin heavy subunit
MIQYLMVSSFSFCCSELNTQNAGQQKELRQLRQDKAALEARLDRVSAELEGTRDLKRALDGTRAELARTQKECEAKLLALDADAKSIVSRAQSAANDLKAQLQPITDRAIRAEQTIEQQRAEYTKVISNERAANDALNREREKLAQEIKKNAALMQAKTVAEERLSGHEQTIAGMQQRLQEQSVALKAAGVREKELNTALERDRESSAQTEKSLRRRISELEQQATEAQVCIAYCLFLAMSSIDSIVFTLISVCRRNMINRCCNFASSTSVRCQHRRCWCCKMN